MNGGRRIKGDQRGLTLIEFMMAIAVAAVIFMVLYSLLDVALASFNLGQLRSRAVQQGRITTMRILNDLRYAEDIYIADDDRIFIKCPAEGDTSSHFVQYRYYPGTLTITRRVSDIPGAGEETFMEGVASFSLIYRDSYHSPLTVPIPVFDTHKIRFIEIDIRLQDDDYWITLHNLAVMENPLQVLDP